MKWTVEIEEHAHFTFVRIGWWLLARNNETGEGSWLWVRRDSSNFAEQRNGKHWCGLHPRPVRFNGLHCPACQAEREFLALTEITEKGNDELASINLGR